MWYILQGGIFAGMFTFLRGACPDCAPSSASVLSVIAALVVTVTIVGLYESAISARNFIQRRRAKQRLNKGAVRLSPLVLGKRGPGADHLTKLRHLPPH
jgi:hypothetical protein